ncbi:MAG: hypothetical protein KDB10_10425, partial [Acidimicrobiales bacterium]|nr:hypothetical protein [Acidimicrobiales bacterium]
CVGDDGAGSSVRDLADAAGIDASRLVVDPGRDTTVKTRVVARGQQIVRIDHEAPRTLSGGVRRDLVRAARRAAEQADAVVISDYDKGVVDDELVQVVVEAAADKPVVVDPKRPDLSAYRGATVVTPNTAELERAVGYPCPTVDVAVGAARSLLDGLGGAALLVTLGPLGMVLVARGSEPFHAPARARTVYDVTGAGDTVVGALALALAGGFTPEA